MASNPITMKRDGSGSLAQKLLAINPPPGYVYGSAYSGLGDDSGNPNPSTIDAGIVIFSVIEGVTVYDRDHPRGQSFGSWCANHGITGEEYSHLSNAVQSATPPYLTACVPVFAPRCVLCSGPGGGLLIRGNSLLCRVGHIWEIHRFSIPEIPPSIEAESYLTEYKHDYWNVITIAARRPSTWGSNEAGELVSGVEMDRLDLGTPWPEDLHRAVVIGTKDGWSHYMIPMDGETENGHEFAGVAGMIGTTPDDDRLSQLENVRQNLANAQANDPSFGNQLIPAPTVGDAWRAGLYFANGRLVMALAKHAVGRGDPNSQVPYSLPATGDRFLLGPFDINGASYPDASRGTGVATNGYNQEALYYHAFFAEDCGTTIVEQSPFAEMTCVVKSGNGRGTSSVEKAVVKFTADSEIEVKINGASPHNDVAIQFLDGIATISVPLDSYWSRSGSTWSAGQTISIVARWRAYLQFFPITSCGFDGALDVSAPTPNSVEFDEFRQWDFGSPSQN